ncbi:MAG: response regulator [Deltaproteobacteria bacterium]|nr:response regulator [Deltaproteobacteria bacterium]
MSARPQTREHADLTGTLILVDDDQLAGCTMRRLLQRAFPSLDVRMATDGDAALELLDQDVVCIVSDIDMPVRDGIELAWAIRNAAPYGPWRQLPIILVSAACRDEELIERAWGLGIAHIVRKPFSADEIERAVVQATTWVRRRPLEGARADTRALPPAPPAARRRVSFG